MDTQGGNETRLVAKRVSRREQFWRYLIGTVALLAFLWIEFDYWGVDSWLRQAGWGWLVRSMNAITGILFLGVSWDSFRGREDKWWLLRGVSGLGFAVVFFVCAVIDREVIVR